MPERRRKFSPSLVRAYLGKVSDRAKSPSRGPRRVADEINTAQEPRKGPAR
jgi:hypothetical protein